MHNTKRVGITEGVSFVKVDKRQNSLTNLVPVANLTIIHFLILLLHVSDKKANMQEFRRKVILQ